VHDELAHIERDVAERGEIDVAAVPASPSPCAMRPVIGKADAELKPPGAP